MESNSIVQLLGIYNTKGISDIHLLELNINTSPKDVDVSSFTQKDDTLPKDSWQTPYDEHFLNDDGTEVIGTFLEQDSLTGVKTRIAFFMYFIDFNKPLLSQYGEILLPEQPSLIPDRLSKIIEFESAD
jgi:hypothetical protein